MSYNPILKFSAVAVVAMMSLNAAAYELTSWQSELPDEAYVSTLSLPGAHDAATGEGLLSLASYSQAQTKGLQEIYNCGVRVLDFRPQQKDGRLKCYHGIAEINKWYDDAMREMCDWLDLHPSEFFIIHLYKASDGDINDLMNTLVSEEKVASHLVQFRPDLKVRDMRGKVLFLKREDVTWNSPYATSMERWYENDNLSSGWELRGRIFPTRPGTTDRYDRREVELLVQDIAHSDGDNMNLKKTEAKRIFDFLSTWCPTTRNNMVWTFNFASAYSNSGTSKATGYADNANQVNPFFKECLDASNGPAGMVMIDFVGADEHKVVSGSFGTTTNKTTYGQTLVEAVIAQNFKYINSYVDRQVTEVQFNNHSWAGVLWDNMFYGNNLFADVNNDGYLDYVIASSQQESGTQYFATNNGNGGFNFMTERVFGTSFGNHVLVPVDYNNDGLIDMLVVKSGSAEMMMNAGNGSFSKASVGTINRTTSISEDDNFEGRAVAIDLNHNGLKDIVIYNSSNQLKAYINQGDGTFKANTSLNFPKLTNGTIAVGDYDCDGFADILISGKTGESDDRGWPCLAVNIVLTRADLNFEILAPESLQPYATYDGGVMFVDVNMDGKLDVFLSGLYNDWNRHDSYATTLLINKGNDEFEPAGVLGDPVKKGNADWADITGNGRPDIVYAGENHIGYYTSTIINLGEDNYKAESTMDGHRASTSVAAYDYRGVGRASVGVMGHSWDSSANQMFDAEVPAGQAPSMAPLSSGIDASVLLAELVPGEEDTPGVILAVQNADQVPSGYLYNYVLKLNDGRIVSNVPVSESTGMLLTSDVNSATSATTIVYPTIKKSDVASVGLQVIGPDKKAAALELSKSGITTGIDAVADDNADAPVEYYNLQGVRVENPSGGLYIRRQGNRSEKVVL